MGTTLCGVGIVEVGGSQHCIVFNVGDSRVYSFRHGALTQVSVDHSEVQELRAAGRISQQAALRYPRRNVITRCLGSDPSPTPDLWVFPPVDKERFLVCSDGLTGELDDADDHPAARGTSRARPGRERPARAGPGRWRPGQHRRYRREPGHRRRHRPDRGRHRAPGP